MVGIMNQINEFLAYPQWFATRIVPMELKVDLDLSKPLLYCVQRPMHLYLDNDAANTIISNVALSDKVKHLEVHHLVARKYSQDEVLAYDRVDTSVNLSDIFTKPLAAFQFGFKRWTYFMTRLLFTGVRRVIVPVTGLQPPHGCTHHVGGKD